MKIVDPESCRELPHHDGGAGEIWLDGLYVVAGYFYKTELLRETFYTTSLSPKDATRNGAISLEDENDVESKHIQFRLFSYHVNAAAFFLQRISRMILNKLCRPVYDSMLPMQHF